jgi:hypothetical protein
MTPSCKSCSVRTIIEETESIDMLKKLIDFHNAYKLHSFKVRLVIDEPEREPVDGRQGGLS